MQRSGVRHAARGISRSIAALALVFAAQLASAQDVAWGPEVGSSLPALEAPDETGRARQLADLAGDNGLLLVFSRSFDW